MKGNNIEIPLESDSVIEFGDIWLSAKHIGLSPLARGSVHLSIKLYDKDDNIVA